MSMIDLLATAAAQAPTAIPGAIDRAFTSINGGQPSGMSLSLQLLLLMGLLTILPSLILMMTSFTRVLVVMGILRQALGLQQSPPNQVLVGLKRSLAQFGTQVIMPGATGNEPKTLAEIGLSIQRDGTFKLDTGRLNSMLTADPQGVAAMFTNGLYGVFASFDALARRATSTSDPGSLGGSIARYTAQATKLKADQTDLADRQEELRSQLITRFARMNAGVGASKSTLSFLKNQIDAWNSKN